jgi:hypothetical protein
MTLVPQNSAASAGRSQSLARISCDGILVAHIADAGPVRILRSRGKRLVGERKPVPMSSPLSVLAT